MSSGRIIHDLRTFTVPGSVESRERALSAARDAYRSRGALDARRPRRPRRIAIAATCVAAVVAISLTPAGHAATGWVTQLVGFGHIPKNHPPRGHVGGPPTHRTSFGLYPPYPQVIIAKGTTPNGQRYEVSVSRSPQSKYGTCFELWSPRAGQPSNQGTGQCASEVRHEVIGPVCVADSSGCGAPYRSRKDHTWTSPAIAA